MTAFGGRDMVQAWLRWVREKLNEPDGRWVAAISVLLALLFGGVLLAGWARVPAYGPDLPTDGAQGQFIFAEVARAVWGGGSLLWTDRVWFPTGYPFLLSEQNVADALLISPFVALLGPTLPIAWFSFLVLVTNGLAGGWLARMVAGPGWPSVAGAVLLGASPYVFGELSCGRITQAWLAPMCLALGTAWRAAEGGRRRAVFAGILLALAGYHYWFYGLFVAIGVVMAVASRAGLKRGAGILAVIGATSAILVAPAIVYVAVNWQAMPGVDIDASGFRWPARILAGLPGMEAGPINHETRYLPHLLFLVVGLSFFSWPRRTAVSLSIAAMFLVIMSMGESATVGDAKLLLPYGWLIRVPGLSRFWWPARAIGAATVLLVPVAALVVRRLRGPHLVAGAVALGLCILQALYLPGRIGTVEGSCDTAWAQTTPNGAVVVLPMLSEAVGRRASFLQPCHGRPLVNGNGMWDGHLWPPTFRAFFETQPLLNALLATETGTADDIDTDSSAVSRLAAAGVTTILVPAGLIAQEGPAAREAALLTRLVGPPTCPAGAADCYWVLE